MLTRLNTQLKERNGSRSVGSPHLVAAGALRIRLVDPMLTHTQPTSNQEICQGKQQRHHHIRDSVRLSFQQGLEVRCREG
jgi:cobalamin biosynthesis protein CobD/CbiB